MKQAKKRAVARLGAGAKAPKLSDRMIELEKKIEEGFISMKINRDFNAGFGEKLDPNRIRAEVAATNIKTISPPPNSPSYKSRLEAIYAGLCELRGMQNNHRQYLNPQPQTAGASENSTPCGLDELLSAIESELNINQLMFRDLANKF